MIWSKYNYFLKCDKAFLLYNSLSNGFAELEEDVYSYLIMKKENNDDSIEDIELKSELIRMKVLIENDKDELNELKYVANSRRYSNKVLDLTINPTLHCNFACKYCYEENRSSVYMLNEVEGLIIDYIKKQKQIEALDVTWFGGEPLMAFDRIISLTDKIKKLEIKFVAGIITNGYLLTENVANKLNSLNINRIQITVDGLAEIHNSRRCLVSGKGTFDEIVKNIELLKKVNPDIRLTIRVNIDENNKDQFIQVYNFFESKKMRNVFVTPAFVDDILSCETNSCLFDRKRKIEFLMDLQKRYNIDFSYLYFPSDVRYECGIRNPNSLIIGPVGEIYKCWNDVGKNDRVVGSLDDKMKPNNRLLLRYLTGADPFDSEECKTCFHFPTCGGGCPYLRIKNEYEGYNFDTCIYAKGHLEEVLKQRYADKKKQEKL